MNSRRIAKSFYEHVRGKKNWAERVHPQKINDVNVAVIEWCGNC